MLKYVNQFVSLYNVKISDCEILRYLDFGTQ